VIGVRLANDALTSTVNSVDRCLSFRNCNDDLRVYCTSSSLSPRGPVAETAAAVRWRRCARVPFSALTHLSTSSSCSKTNASCRLFPAVSSISKEYSTKVSLPLVLLICRHDMWIFTWGRLVKSCRIFS